MAKADAKAFMEQHVEKIVLGICGLVLLYGLYAAFMRKTTVEAPIGPGQTTREVSLDELDPGLRQSASDLSNVLDDNDPSTFPPNVYPQADLLEQFLALRNQPIDPQLGQVASFWTGQEPLRLDVQEVAKASLEPIVASIPEPAAPRVRSRMVVPYTPGDQERGIPGELQEKGVATIASQFDLTKLRQNWVAALSQTLIDPTFVIYDVQVEMQHLRPDGTWTQPEIVQTARVNLDPNQVRGGGMDDYERPRYERNRPAGAGSTVIDETSPQPIPEFTGNNAARVLDFVDARRRWELAQLQPEYHPFFHFSTIEPKWVHWQALLPKTPLIEEFNQYLDAQMRLDQGGELGGTGGPGARPEQSEWGDVRTGQREFNVPQIQVRPKPQDPSERTNNIGQPTQPRRFRNEYDDDEFFDEDGPVDFPPRQVQPQPGRGDRLVAEPVEKNPAPEPTRYPPFEAQLRKGTVLMWAHYDKLQPGQQVRFRMRIRLVNPLLTLATEVSNPEDARKPTVASPWTDWTDTVSLPQTGAFYIAGTAPAGNWVRVEVYRKAFDQWVNTSFEVGPGQAIGDKKEVYVFNPLLGVKQKKTVGFDTGGLAVDIDFSKLVPLLGGGVVPRTTTTTELVYSDALGNFVSKLRSADDVDPRRRQLRDDTKQVTDFLDVVLSYEAFIEQFRQDRERVGR